MRKELAAIAFLLTIPAANWMIGNVGHCGPGGVCTVPVGFGLLAPSGVLMIGAAFVLRDWVHEMAGVTAVALLVILGGALSFVIAPAALAAASCASFLLSELADLYVYEPLRKRALWAAVVLSGVAGSVVDSVVFLLLAFQSLQFLEGQVVGKVWMSLLGAIVLVAMRRRMGQCG